MATPEELLAKLKERFILDEISEASYHELKAEFEAKLSNNVSSSAGGQNLGEGSVIKGDISNTTGAASVGNVILNVPAPPTSVQATTEIVKCPFCGLRNKPVEVFTCRLCGQDNLCRDHFDRTSQACKQCVAKAESLHAKAERERQAEREAKRSAQRAGRTSLLDGLILSKRTFLRPMIAWICSLLTYTFIASITENFIDKAGSSAGYDLVPFPNLDGAPLIALFLLCPLLPAVNLWLFIMRGRVRARWPRNSALVIKLGHAWLLAELVFFASMMWFHFRMPRIHGDRAFLISLIPFAIAGAVLSIILTVHHNKTRLEKT